MNGTGFHCVEQALVWPMLTVKGVVVSEFGIAPGNEFEVNDGDDVGGEDFGKVIDDEVGAVRAQGFVVEFQRYFVMGLRGRE